MTNDQFCVFEERFINVNFPKGLSYGATNQSCTLLFNTLENHFISVPVLSAVAFALVSCLCQWSNLATVMLSEPGKTQHSYILAAVLFGKYCSLSKTKSKSFSIFLWQILHWDIELQFSRVAKEYCIVMLYIKLQNIALEYVM